MLAAALCLCATEGLAGSFHVSPVRATLKSARAVEALRVHNDGAEPAVIQIEAMAWSQEGGKDHYTPTKDLIATPPIFTVPAGGSQIVRVGSRRAADASRELTYRLYLQEVPPPPKPGFQGLQVALRIGIPVFILPAAGIRSELEWRARRAGPDELWLEAANIGNAHVQIFSVDIGNDAGARLGGLDLSSYVLPGQQRRWRMKTAAPAGSAVRLKVRSDAGDIEAQVPVDPR